MRRTIVGVALVIAAAALTGCGVSKQVVAEKDAALQSCTADLAACQVARDAARAEAAGTKADLDAARKRAADAERDLAACQAAAGMAEESLRTARQELDACRAEAASARGDLEKASQDLDACRTEATRAREAAEAARKEAAALKAREDDLRSRLQTELADKTVEIENLRGRLSVRVVDKILFDSGSAQILPEGQGVLKKVAAALKTSSELIRVEGHTDDVPIGAALKDKYFSNWELSAARAASVVRHFQYGQEIDPARLEAVGLSMYRPVAPNDSPANRQRNRRVEIVLTAPR